MNEEIFDAVIRDWLGVGYAPSGRTSKGIDCVFLPIAIAEDYCKRAGFPEDQIIRPPKGATANYDFNFFLRQSAVGLSIVDEVCKRMSRLKRRDYPQESPKKGDVLVFAQGLCPGGHMGICISDTGDYIHALMKRGVAKDNLSARLFKLSSVYQVDYTIHGS